VAHEVRNPLTAVRTFAEMLPERWSDPEFRERFDALVGEGLTRVEEVVERLERLAAFPAPQRRAVDVGTLLEDALDARRQAIHERRLLVLKELDPNHPAALGDPVQVRAAFEALLDQALALVPPRGDLFLASRHHAAGLRGGPSVRVLVRFQTGTKRERVAQERRGAAPLPDVSPAANALAFAMAETLIRAQGGAFALDSSDASEALVVVDLPAPSD